MKRLIAPALVLAAVALAAPVPAHAGLFGRILGRGPVSRTRTVTRTRTVVRGGGGAAVVQQAQPGFQAGFGAVQQRQFVQQQQYVAPVQAQFGAAAGQCIAPAQVQQFSAGAVGGY